MEIIKYPIKPEKEKSWHLYAHPYFTKQASNVVGEYIKNYSNEGDTILDPFCGTGVTIIEALAAKRKVIGLDINPLACFITDQTVKKVDLNLLIKEYNRITDLVKDEIEGYDTMPKKRVEDIKIKYWYPTKIKLPKDSDKDIQTVEDLWTHRQLLGLSILWNEILNIKDKDIQKQMQYIFSATVSRVNVTFHDSYKLDANNVLKRINGGSVSILSHYRYWTPKRLVELPVWKSFENRFKLILKAKEKWNQITKDIDVNNNYQIINASIFDLDKHIKQDSIDYIYTDPPYGGNIAYLDLSTMWNAWLGFKVTNKMKKDEIIEGGDQDKTQDEYEDMFSKSFEKMGEVLRKDGWMSLVFAHKKLEFWNVIIDSCEKNGLEFKGSTFQPTNNSSIHYKKNPANVLCSQRIANFQKTFKQSKKEKSDNLAYYILNEIERSCIEARGASLDKIYQRVLDKLLDNKLIYEAKKKGYIKLDQFLDDTDLFLFDVDTGLYYVKDKSKTDDMEKRFFANKNEIKIYLQSMLKANKAMTVDQIHKEIFELFKDEKTFPLHEQDIEEILNEIAYKSKKSNKWLPSNVEQVAIGFENVLSSKLVKINSDGLSHSEIIYRLFLIGKYLGFNSWIGKREQDSAGFANNKFNEISIKKFPIVEGENLSKEQLDKIKQIDLIWFDIMNNPRYAFEVEESTQIISAFDRFTNLLKVEHKLGRHLFVVLPKSRQKAFENKLKTSEYIGAPIYLNTKMKFIFKEDLKKFYDEHINKDFDEADMRAVFSDVEI